MRALMMMSMLLVTAQALAEWNQVAENQRSVAYIDSAITWQGDVAKYWVMFDYKFPQVSPRSGRRYQSEKAQHEVDCASDRDRTLFFTWHSEAKGNGVVVFSSASHKNWEPTTSPDSVANILWTVVCQARQSKVQSRKLGTTSRWEILGSSPDVDLYYDPSTLTVIGDMRRAWVVQNWKSVSNGVASIRILQEIDCRSSQSRSRSASTHTELFAQGLVLLTSTKLSGWEDIPPGTLIDAERRLFCTRN